MTDTPSANASSKTPTHYAFQVRDREGKAYFTKIGAVWPHRDEKGFSIQLECLPLDGRITLRVVDEE